MKTTSTGSKTAPKVPITAEWLYIRTAKDYKVESRDFVKENVHLVAHNQVLPQSNVPSTHVAAVVKEVANQVLPQSTVPSTHVAAVVKEVAVVATNGLKKAHELSWPPVLPDGSIPADEGEDVMPLIGLKVPRFWEAPPGSSDADINRIGRK
eukprot:gene33692-43545_t